MTVSVALLVLIGMFVVPALDGYRLELAN